MSPVKRSAAASGLRDRFIELVPIEEGRSLAGWPTETDDTPRIGLWVSKEDISGRERIVFNAQSAPYDSRFVLPWGTAYNPDTVDVPKVFALDYQGRRYDIVSAAEIGRREGVELMTLAREG